MPDIDDLVSIVTQKSGVPESVTATIIPLLVQFVTQKLASRGVIGGFLSRLGEETKADKITTTLASLDTISFDHPLVEEVKEKANLPEATMAADCIKLVANIIREEAGTNPKHIEKLFSS